MHGWCSSRLRVEPIFVRFDDEVGFCLVRKELGIFDSVVGGFLGRQSGDSHSLRIRNGESQQTLNCALSVDLL